MLNSRPAVTLLLAVASAFSAVQAQAAPGDFLPTVNASFVDSGRTYWVTLGANESPTQAGNGNLYFQINGPGLSGGSVNASGTTINLGGAGNQPVSFSDKALDISVHSWVHSDFPNRIVYVGPVTTDIRLDRESGKIRIEIAAPKGDIKLEGKLMPWAP